MLEICASVAETVAIARKNSPIIAVPRARPEAVSAFAWLVAGQFDEYTGSFRIAARSDESARNNWDSREMRFSLIDRITSIEPGKSITAIKNLSLSEEYLADH